MTIGGSVPAVHAKLGVHPVIHGAGTTTRYGGSLMRPETVEAMREAAHAAGVVGWERSRGGCMSDRVRVLAPFHPAGA